MKKSVLIIIIISIVIFLFLIYLLKTHRQVDLFESFSLSSHLPFSPLVEPEEQGPVIQNVPYDGIVINENFNDGLMAGGWDGLWARETGTVIRRLNRDDQDGPRHLFIRNLGHEDWAIDHGGLIIVSPGNEFYYHTRLKTGGQAEAVLGVALHTKDRKISQWMYEGTKAANQTEWTQLKNTFEIPEDVRFIRLRLTGSGKGDVLVDDFLLKRTSTLR